MPKYIWLDYPQGRSQDVRKGGAECARAKIFCHAHLTFDIIMQARVFS